MLAALLVQLSVVAIAAFLMQASLKRRAGEGLFSALPSGLIPPLILGAALFAQVHLSVAPEAVQARADWQRHWTEMLKALAPKPLTEAELAAGQLLGTKLYGLMPAFYFCFQAAVVAAVGAWLRRRMARLGLAGKPQPLAQWTAPFAMVWLVLGPVFWVFGGQKGVLQGPPWAMALAGNLLVIGLALYLFQGAVILGAKLVAWSRDPGTRALTPLVLAAVVASLLLLNGQGLLVFLVLTGLFDPWIDLRRLHAKPEDGEVAPK